MCVADFKPEAGPVQRAWVVLHNLGTVVDQARENYALGEFEDERPLAHVLVGLEQAQAKALVVYRELRERYSLPESIEEEFKRSHGHAAARNQADH